MVDRIRRFQVSGLIVGWFVNKWLLCGPGAKQSDLRYSEQVSEDFLQRDREHARGARTLLPASHPPGRTLLLRHLSR